MATNTPPSTLLSTQPTQAQTQSSNLNTSSSFSSSQSTISLPPALSPATLDVLPLLTHILYRVQTSINTTAAPQSQIPGSTPSQNITSTPSASAVASSTIDKSPFATAPLTAKEIPFAADELRQRIKKARVALSSLPDLDVSVEEQEEEIRQLEERIKKQKEALGELRHAAARGAQGLAGRDGRVVGSGEEQMDVS